MKVLLGIDVGSISTKGVILDTNYRVLASEYLRTLGNPISAIRQVLRKLKEKIPEDLEVIGVGTTGSGRRLAGVIVGADIVKNEIIAHAVAASTFYPECQTIIEIGGQDSKIIILRNGVPVDFAMNTVCAAGTGSFLDHQAQRLNIPIEEFGKIALSAKTRVKIAGRCTVFAESDMIHKAQLGLPTADIIAGLCDAIVRNYMNVVAKGKDIRPLILFQGGVAANEGVKEAFVRELKCEIIVPEYFLVMGAIGAAILAFEETNGKGSKFSGFQVADMKFETRAFECNFCPNQCEVIETYRGEELIDIYGDRCGRYSGS
ncbi:MAG: acyl-CoA dehydratase activase [candidate division WOR-3 bacterium]